MTRVRGAREEGAAIVWALALVSVILLVGLVVSAVAVQVVARQRAATAAEVSALAAAQAIGDRCAAASRAAVANDAALVACAAIGLDVEVTISAPPPELVSRVLGLIGRQAPDVTATARAGPSL